MLCLQEQRFAVVVDWFVLRDHLRRRAWAETVPHRIDDSGLFWFFSPDNWELMAKVLDGCAHNGHFRVFSSAATKVGYTVSVADTQTGTARHYSNPWQNLPSALTDTTAFPTCP